MHTENKLCEKIVSTSPRDGRYLPGENPALVLPVPPQTSIKFQPIDLFMENCRLENRSMKKRLRNTTFTSWMIFSSPRSNEELPNFGCLEFLENVIEKQWIHTLVVCRGSVFVQTVWRIPPHSQTDPLLLSSVFIEHPLIYTPWNDSIEVELLVKWGRIMWDEMDGQPLCRCLYLGRSICIFCSLCDVGMAFLGREETSFCEKLVKKKDGNIGREEFGEMERKRKMTTQKSLAWSGVVCMDILERGNGNRFGKDKFVKNSSDNLISLIYRG